MVTAVFETCVDPAIHTEHTLIMDERAHYDAVVTLGGGLQRRGDEYYPADYRDSDEFGMLGGHMRLHAALLLLLAGRSDTFFFTTGAYEKNKRKFGPDVPPESVIYQQRFREELAKMTQAPKPALIAETVSTTTAENVHEVIKMAGQRNWKNVAIITSTYHVPRVVALIKREQKWKPGDAEIRVLPAEDVVRKLDPGIYDGEIERAYASPAAHRRLESEQRRLADLLAQKKSEA